MVRAHGIERHAVRLVSSIALTCISLASVASGPAQLEVRVAIPKHAQIVAALEPACVAADSPVHASITRAEATYRVRSTALAGIELEIRPLGEFESVEVRVDGLPAPARLPASGGTIVLRGHPTGERQISLEFAFVHAAPMQPSCTPWPVDVRAAPL
jgi:hypothetical protein